MDWQQQPPFPSRSVVIRGSRDASGRPPPPPPPPRPSRPDDLAYLYPELDNSNNHHGFFLDHQTLNSTTANITASSSSSSNNNMNTNSTTTSSQAAGGDSTTAAFFAHSSAPRINTRAEMAKTLTAQYPELHLSIVDPVSCNLLAFAAAGHASANPILDDSNPGDWGAHLEPHHHTHTTPKSAHGPAPGPRSSHKQQPALLIDKLYLPPARRIDGAAGNIARVLEYARFWYRWGSHEFLVYFCDGRDGSNYFPSTRAYYVLSAAPDPAAAEANTDALVLAAGRWTNALRSEVWVFDQGYWSKSAELFASVRGATWDAVILDPAMKRAVIDDHLTFFDGRDAYSRLRVPWKRGVIYHGPPGNGKTISIKAMMNQLYQRKDSVPTLYVRSLASFAGPEYSVRQIFTKARAEAPCYLVFEDLDTIVSDSVRSYFLNEVDGLKSNDGIFMVGSTNHLDKLDPGISKRPSRFDRKYYFPDPDQAQRVAYCRFWQRKLKDNKDVEFPDRLCRAVAGITDGFSFAYIQEAFVAALLAIARRSDALGSASSGAGDDVVLEELDGGWLDVADMPERKRQGGGDDGDGDGGNDDDDEDLEKLVLWREIKKQVKILREGMEDKKGTVE